MTHAKLFRKRSEVEVKQYGQPTPANPLDQNGKGKDEDDLKIKKPLLPGQPGNGPGNAAYNGPMLQQRVPNQVRAAKRPKLLNKKSRNSSSKVAYQSSITTGQMRSFLETFSDEAPLRVVSAGAETVEIPIYEMWDAGGTPTISIDTDPLLAHAETSKHSSKKMAGFPKGIFRGPDSLGGPSVPYEKKGGRRYKATGEFRPPLKGEYYLSGAIVQAYRAPSDLNTPYWIAVETTVSEACPTCGRTAASHQDMINDAMSQGEFGRRYDMGPKAEAAARKKANNDLAMLSRKYHSAMPLQEIKDILQKHGFDPRVMDGIYTGEEGKMHEQCGSKTWIAMTWHKLPKTGLWEIVVYLS
jgi:hypothetical protein